LLGPGPRLIKKEFTGPRSHKGWETLPQSRPRLSSRRSQFVSHNRRPIRRVMNHTNLRKYRSISSSWGLQSNFICFVSNS